MQNALQVDQGIRSRDCFPLTVEAARIYPHMRKERACTEKDVESHQLLAGDPLINDLKGA
jgi:hypothetical protein